MLECQLVLLVKEGLQMAERVHDADVLDVQDLQLLGILFVG